MTNVVVDFNGSDHSPKTRERILDVAEELLSHHGIGNTSVRTITEAAKVNVAAVNYHFGSKEKLIRAVIERRFQALEDARSAALDEVESRAEREGRVPAALELVEALISPVFDQVFSGDHGWAHFMRFISRITWEPAADTYAPPASSMKIFQRFDEMLKQVVPELADDEGRRCWRLAFLRATTQQTILMLTTLMAGHKPQGMAFIDGLNKLDNESIRRECIAFAAAGLAIKPA